LLEEVDLLRGQDDQQDDLGHGELVGGADQHVVFDLQQGLGLQQPELLDGIGVEENDLGGVLLLVILHK
jgi:hypothetical protein